ncbi:MAG: transporter substrate-binding domain-containing protein [Desulfobacteraceae bacterium]
MAGFTGLAVACLLVLPVVVSAGTQAPIKSAAEIDYPPFSMVDENGRADGFSVELMREALRAMNREAVFRTGPWALVRSWLEKGQIQALPLVGRTPEREALFDFTFPYMSLHGAIVVRKDNSGIHDLGDLRGRQVAVMKGDNAEEFLRREERGIEIHTTATFEEALQQLSQGRYDAVVIQRLVALRLLQEMGLVNLKVLDRPIEGFRQDFCFAVREGDRDTLALLNEGLAIVMADGAYRRLHAKWFAALQLPSDRPIVVGGDHDYPPFEYIDDNGRPTGYNVELTRAIALEMGLNIEIRLGPWAEIVRGMEEGEIDVIQGMFYLPERDVKFDFTQPHTVHHYVSVVREGDGDPPVTLEDLAGKRVVVQRGDAAHDFLVAKGLGRQVSLAESQEDVLRELAEGKHDCALAVRISSLHLIEKQGWKNLSLGRQAFLPLEYCYAAPDNHKAILAQFSEGLKVLEQKGEYRRIYEKWLGSYKERPLSLVRTLRYSAMVLIPLVLILLAIFLWTWSLRRRVREKTRELKESAEFQRAMIACSPVALYSIDLQGNVQAWNTSAERIFGWTAEEVMGKPLPIVPEEKQEEFAALRKRVTRTGGFSGMEVVRQRKDGTCFDASLSAGPIYNEQGEIIGIMASLEDITERKQAEEALRAAESRYRIHFENVTDVIYSLDHDLKLMEISPSVERLLGYKPEELIGKPLQELNVLAQESLEQAAYDAVRVLQGERITAVEYQFISRDGTKKWGEVSGSPLMREGRVVAIVSVARDITSRKRAQRERDKLQDQLLQAQKMESVGRLAGGVAHDFNNMLSVIQGGHAELALLEIKPEDPLFANLQEIRKAARHSVDITRQLLAFARKQTIAPKVLDLNETVEGMLKMLRRLIGEDIDLAWEPDTNLWPVNMDPVQLDQILANLCVNARDAIRGVGKVTIETENVILSEDDCAAHAGTKPGEYVMLAVSDDGMGMDRETLANAFEPFFTTKELGKGTGLGLSTVYGIVRQNQGAINVYSEPDKGTTFRIYLPPHLGEAEDIPQSVRTEMPKGRGETVLVVEDEASVLRLARRVLHKLGYTVLTSGNPAEAVNIAREYAGTIHLLMTDVVLPEMSGKDLAGEISKIRPAIRTLYMSGYTANVIAHHGVLDKGVHFVGKPFTFDSLARKVREVMGNE